MRNIRRTAAAGLAVWLLAEVSPIVALTTVTDYTYNADGALTAITKSVDSGPAETTFLVWDNFVPEESDPATGTVREGKGTLAGLGPTTAEADWTESFSFDARDRLISYAGDGVGEIFDYHANGLMSSSSSQGDTLSFYYEATSVPNTTNLYQESTDLWSAHLGSMRFLNDGGEQAVLRPRKDSASLYTPASERLQSYVYDAFGAGSRDESPQAYDLQQNPFQYTGEYRDPVWGGYYLRARWYHPGLPLFVSRDPLPFLNRYSYTDGNPVMRSDPSGMSYMSAFGRPLGKFLSKINKGVGGDFARLFLAPILGPLQILANPAGFWDQVKHDRNGIDVFLALGIASEVAGGIGDYLYAGYAVSIGKRFLARAASDALIGLGQTVTASASRGFNHFDWQSFRQGAELTAGAIFARSYTGANVRSGFRLDTGDVLETIKRLDQEPGETALVFRMKTRIQKLGRASDYLPSAKPLQQAFKIGAYHETLIAVTKDDVFVTEAYGSGIHAYRIDNPGYAELAKSLRSGYGSDARYELAGTVYDFDTRRFLSNPRDRPVARTAGLFNVRHSLAPKVDATQYGNVLNNCQHHAAGVLKNLGVR